MEHDDPVCATCDEEGIVLVIEGKPKPVGNLQVARTLPVRERRAVGPFVFFDHMGPVTFAPGEGFDVKPHPHIGLSTVTYLLEGEGVHRDSMGNVQVVRPGEVNLMSAGRGVAHSERSDAATRARGGAMEGLQLWVALPAANEDDEPSFAHAGLAELPRAHGEGWTARVLLGDAFGVTSPLPHPSRPLFVDVALDEGASLDVPADGLDLAVYVARGEIQVGARAFRRQRLLVRAPGARVRLRALGPSRVVLLGGPALPEPRFIEWNFVATSRERIARAKAAWRARTFPPIPGDDAERVELPDLARP
jgi:redox-sensitive bicupin YhaK (pirin superfamily)